jgi:Tol biopolymer transport system component
MRRIALLMLTVALFAPSAAEAAFPGANGKIAYDSGQDGDWEIYVVNPDGTGKVQLTQNSSDDRDPAWSPDGSKLAFVCCTVSSPEIWVMSAAGSNPVKITEGTGFASSPAWSPDGSKIVFGRTVCNSGSCTGEGEYFSMELWTVDANGTNETRLLQAGFALEPRWSPDGTRIAFGYGPGSALGAPWIATVTPSGSDLTPVTPQFGNCFEYGPDWSPNGAKLVFEGENTLFTINADGSDRSGACFGPPPAGFVGESPVWSPDGTKIAFLHRPSGDNWEVHTANPDFTGEQDVTEIAPALVSPGPPRGLDWQPIPGPQRTAYKNAAQFCKAEREFWGEGSFQARYGGGANAHGKCVSQKG